MADFSFLYKLSVCLEFLKRRAQMYGISKNKKFDIFSYKVIQLYTTTVNFEDIVLQVYFCYIVCYTDTIWICLRVKADIKDKEKFFRFFLSFFMEIVNNLWNEKNVYF